MLYTYSYRLPRIKYENPQQRFELCEFLLVIYCLSLVVCFSAVEFPSLLLVVCAVIADFLCELFLC